MSDYWFKPKTHGYGAYPSNWKGWALTVAYVLAVLALCWSYMDLPSDGAAKASPPVEWWAALAMLTVAFVWLCYIKTSGGWRWRWGKETGDRP